MKKNLFAVLIVLVLVVIGVGFYRGWFALSSSSADQGSNKVNVNLTVDRDKMQEDAEAVKNKSHGADRQGHGRSQRAWRSGKRQQVKSRDEQSWRVGELPSPTERSMIFHERKRTGQ